MKRDGIARRRAVATLAFSILVCLVVAGAASTRFFGIVELNGFDRLIGVQGEPRPIAQIAFVDITDATVNEIGEWPIPRGVIAQVIRRIAQGQPELIGRDMQVSEKRDPEEDQALAAVLAEAGNVVVPASLTERGVVTEPRPEFRAAALDVGLVNMQVDRYVNERLVRLLRHVRGWRRRPFSLREWSPARFAGELGLHRLVGTIRYPGQVNAT